MLMIIDPRFTDQVWPAVAPLLEPAVNQNHGDATLDQLKRDVAFGVETLVVCQEDDVVMGAATVKLVQLPNKRVAYMTYAGGVGIVTPEVVGEVGQWCKSQGASELRASCGESRARLYQRVGFEEMNRVVRVQL